MNRIMVVECDRCPMRGTACQDCVVAALLVNPPAQPAQVPLDRDERAAVALLCSVGLVDPVTVQGLLAHTPGLVLLPSVG